MVHTPRTVIEVHHLLLASSVMFWEYRNFAIYGPNTHDVSALMKTMPQFDEQTASTYTHICKHKTSQNKIKGHTHTHKKKRRKFGNLHFHDPGPKPKKLPAPDTPTRNLTWNFHPSRGTSQLVLECTPPKPGITEIAPPNLRWAVGTDILCHPFPFINVTFRKGYKQHHPGKDYVM